MPPDLRTNATMSVRCVVANTIAPLFFSSFSTAQAIAAPCKGSVPVPTSSRSTTLPSSASSIMLDMRDRCDEKVDIELSIDCSSPISTRILDAKGNMDDLSAETGMPDRAIRIKRPAVLIVIVLPPALGPVITITLFSPSREKSSGTTFPMAPSLCWATSRGWAAPFKLMA